MAQTATGSTASQAQEKAQQAADQAREKAQEGAEKARQGLRGQVEQRSTQAGQQVRSQSDDIRTVAQQLREQGKDGPAKLADQAADRAERLGGYLESSDADRIIHDVEDFARRNPWAIALGGLAVGFAASRMLKASSSDRYHGSTGGNGVQGRYGRTTPAGLPRPRTAPFGEGEAAGAAGYDPPVATTPATERYERY
jgi:gas vesicle protein